MESDKTIYAATVHLVDGRNIQQRIDQAMVNSVTHAIVSGNAFKFGDDRLTVLVNPASVTTFEYHVYSY